VADVIGETPAVKTQFEIIAAAVTDFRTKWTPRERAQLLGLVLGLAELVAAEARAQEREACIAVVAGEARMWPHCDCGKTEILAQLRARDER